MPPLAVGLVLAAAVLHAAWNALLKTSGDPLRTAVRLQAIGTAILGPVALLAWLGPAGRPGVPPEVLALIVVSSVLEAAYFVFLAAAYRRGDLSLVYPLARGSAPMLAVLVGLGLLGERLAPIGTAGVVLLLAGLLLTSRPWRVLRDAGAGDRGAVGFALLTGAAIAAYSAVDRVGVRLVEPWLYGALLAAATSGMLVVTYAAGRRLGLVGVAASVDRPERSGLRDAAAGVMSLTAYLLVLVAYSIAPLAAVAPLRESAVVLASVWGVARLGEGAGGRERTLRVGSAGLVLAGAVLLAVGR